MQNKLHGKRICFLGDSITEGFAVNIGQRYFDLLAQRHGFEAYGYGVCGARFDGLYAQAKKMYEQHKENVDIIFVFAGTNDYNGSTPMGEWFCYYDTKVTRTKNADGSPKLIENRMKREPLTAPNTYKGAINRLMLFLKEHYGDKRIILLTPLHRAFATFGNDNIQYDESYSNNQMLFIDDYVNVIKEAAGLYSCELIDLFAESGIYPLSDLSAKAFLANVESDRLHPNAAGHSRIADVIERYLNI